MTTADGEIWRPIPGTDLDYFASTHGRIRSHKRRGRMRILAQAPNDCGYLKVTLSFGKKRRQAYVHRLIVETFIGPCPDGQVVDHIDFDITHNHVTNLRYLTHEENSARHTPEELEGWWGRQRHRMPRSRDRKRAEAAA